MEYKSIIKRFFRYVIKGVPVHKTYPQVSTIPVNELLKNRVALITGGSSGIGLAIGEAFLNSGATVVLIGRNVKKLDDAVSMLQKKYPYDRIYSQVMDMQVVSSFNSAFQNIQKKMGEKKIDILVNNAGVLGCNLSKPDEKSYDSALDTNIKGPFFLSEKMGHYMIENNISGNILNIASSSSFRPAACAYTISKWGLRGFTLGLAKSLIPHNIVVNGIAPGPTATPMMSKGKDDSLYIERNPSHRYVTPEEIGNMAVFLVSGMGRMIVGDIVSMSGGAGLITYDDIDYLF